jgi:hypothetical protein
VLAGAHHEPQAEQVPINALTRRSVAREHHVRVHGAAQEVVAHFGLKVVSVPFHRTVKTERRTEADGSAMERIQARLSSV